MANTDLEQDMPSLLCLEDELTCSICLSPFDCPVTIPCGHNFCQDCLLATWKGTYDCPQCRTHFATKPELKKNTVLSNVVQTFKKRAVSEPGLPKEETRVKAKPDVLCDTCMISKASKTCLTCMASFCAEHVRPHLENPNFRAHQLREPVDDLQERMCPDHGKVMELYCIQHSHCICSLCLQLAHKNCSFSNPDEQRRAKEADLKSKLGLLDGKIAKNQMVVSEIEDLQNKLKDSADNRKTAVQIEYQLIRQLLDRSEREALDAVDHELDSGQTKLRKLDQKFNQNIATLKNTKEKISAQLGQSQTLAFLQETVNLPKEANFDPHAPRINLDSKAVLAAESFTAKLKEHLENLLKQPVQERMQMLTKDVREPTYPPFIAAPGILQPPHPGFPFQRPPGRPPLQVYTGTPGVQLPPHRFRPPGPSAPFSPGQRMKPPQMFDKKTGAGHKNPNKETSQRQRKGPRDSADTKARMSRARSMENVLDMGKGSSESLDSAGMSPDITSAVGRAELLQYGTALTFDPRTAHKRIAISEALTKASVSAEPSPYPDDPARFSVCSQVLACEGFSGKRHYWEIKISSNDYIGLGFAYSSIDRKGPDSRLGRNAESWCVEWFNGRVSAWHANSETLLTNPNAKRVGVLLDFQEGVATFYRVAERAYPFYTFIFPFTEKVYPAFWIFTSGSSVTVCEPKV